MIAVTAHASGSILPVRAKPGAKKDEAIDAHDGALRVAVSAQPEAGKANDAIVALLAELLNLKKSQITLVSGARSKAKKFLIAGLGPDDLIARIEAALTPTIFESPDPEL